MYKLFLIATCSLWFLSCGNEIEDKKEPSNFPSFKEAGETPETVMAEGDTLDDGGLVEEQQEVVETSTDMVEINKNVIDTEGEHNTDQEVEEVKLIEEEEEEQELEKEEILPVRPDHGAWDNLLKANVSSAGKVNYQNIKNNIGVLENYLQHLKEMTPASDWSRQEKLAYWFNLYNAATVHLIATNYPLNSITELHGGKPWDQKIVHSGDKTYSLNEVENSIIRPTFNEPRAHVALNCAAVSCPKLMNAAFLPSRLDNQLEKQSKAWINDNTKNQLTDDKVVVSKIFEWYGGDFESTGIIGFINQYSTKKVQENAAISYKEYDWSLND